MRNIGNGRHGDSAPLHVLACSAPECVDPTIALVTFDDGRDPYRLCRAHVALALSIIDERSIEAMKTKRAIEFYGSLSPLEQYQFDGR